MFWSLQKPEIVSGSGWLLALIAGGWIILSLNGSAGMLELESDRQVSVDRAASAQPEQLEAIMSEGSGLAQVIELESQWNALGADETAAADDRVRPIRMRPGDIRVNRTIDLGDRRYGVELIGHGRISTTADNTLPKKHTRIIWTGPEDQPIIRGSVTDFKLRDFTIVGNGNRVGIHIEARRGFGVGRGTIERVAIYNCETAIKFGSEDWNGNADLTVIRDSWFGHCTNAFENTTSQNIHFLFSNCNFTNIENICNLRGGGHVHIDFAYMTRTHRVFNVPAPPIRFGSQNGLLSISRSHWDQSQDKAPVLYDDQGNQGGRVRKVVAEKLRIQGWSASDHPFISATTGTDIVLRDVDTIPGDRLFARLSGPQRLKFDNCSFSSLPTEALIETDSAEIHFDWCKNVETMSTIQPEELPARWSR